MDLLIQVKTYGLIWVFMMIIWFFLCLLWDGLTTIVPRVGRTDNQYNYIIILPLGSKVKEGGCKGSALGVPLHIYIIPRHKQTSRDCYFNNSEPKVYYCKPCI
jgi:hypothetical protein